MSAIATRRTQTSETSERDVRLNMLNTLLTTPHRKLTEGWLVHAELIKMDPLFYVRLAAWYNDNGELRDHKQLFVINLCLSQFPGHRDVGLAMLREMPPYQVGRVVDFIHGKKIKEVTKTETGVGKNKRIVSTSKIVDSGLKLNIPRSMETEISRYLRERENEPDWFDSCVLMARKTFKRLYSLLHISPSERAQKVLFEEAPPEGSRLAAVKALRDAKTPADQAKAIVDNKVPYRMATTIVSTMTPTILAALISVMSDQELVSNLGQLKSHGAMNNADLKEMINKRLKGATKSRNVSALKTNEANKAVSLDAEMQKNLEDVGTSQLKRKGRITRATAIIVDKSGSMTPAIELGKRVAAAVSTVMDAPLFVYAADNMAYPISAKGTSLADWDRAFAGITANGNTSCGVGIETLRRNKQFVEQIVMITDEGENSSPPFLTSLQNYIKDMAVTPHIVILRVKGSGGESTLLQQRCKNANIDYDAYDFNGDYYSIPELIPYLTKTSKSDLLMDIMSYELPVRKAS